MTERSHSLPNYEAGDDRWGVVSGMPGRQEVWPFSSREQAETFADELRTLHVLTSKWETSSRMVNGANSNRRGNRIRRRATETRQGTQEETRTRTRWMAS